MTARRGRGEGGLHFDETRARWIATAAVGYDARGKRITRKASGRTKTEAKNKLRDMLRDHADGLAATGTTTVEDAVRDWLAYGLAGRASTTAVNYASLAEAGSSAHSDNGACTTCQRTTSTGGSELRPRRSALGRYGCCTRS